MGDLNLVFRAQRLDNQDPDHMEANECRVTEEDVDKREELDRQISNVSWDGRKVFSEGFHAAYLLDNEFLLRTPSEPLDDAGRIASILCYGPVPSEPPNTWSRSVVNALAAFAGRIEENRTISEKSAEVARNALEIIVKKKRIANKRRQALRPVAIALGLAVIGIIFWIFFREEG